MKKCDILNSFNEDLTEKDIDCLGNFHKVDICVSNFMNANLNLALHEARQ